MTENARADSAARAHRPALVVPTNRVTVALPFSKITVQEPNKELAELAMIVAELAILVEAAAPQPEATQLCLRAQALAARLR
jgi:hypothetical protein